VVTDWNAHGQIKGCTNASCPAAINAGVDMYMAPDSWKPLYHSLVGQVGAGVVPMARLDDAVARILRAKLRLGLFEVGKPSSRPYAGRFDLLGSAAHRAIAREAVRKSLVLLKAAPGVLPIRPGAAVLVAGDGADDIGRQSGGWTITWQGTGVANKDFPGGTSIWRGLEQAVHASGGHAELAPDGQFKERPDVAIVVFGETPYAEFQGDLKTLQLRPELRAPYATMQRLKAQGIPVVAVMLTGRPLFVNPEINLADAFVVAWLPGSEGEGIADILVQGGNRPHYDFSGTLPADWPATARHDGPTLFKRGFGRTMAQPGAGWQRLHEEPGVVEGDKPGVFLDKGAPTPSWSLVVSDGGTDATRVTMLPATVLGGRGYVTATDHLVQEGARQFTFTGAGPETVELVNQAPIDVSRETNGDVMLLVTARIDAAPATPFTIEVRCGPGCSGVVAVPQLAANAIGQWQTIGIPLKCFAQAGAVMTRLTTPFRLSTAGAARFSLARVALGTVADQVAECPH
jgi:beta-glucosidase